MVCSSDQEEFRYENTRSPLLTYDLSINAQVGNYWSQS